MPAEYSAWWLDRAGDVAAATTSNSQPEPVYGAAVDFGAANTSPLTYEDMVNAIMTATDEEDAEAALASMMNQGGEPQQQPQEPEDDDGLWAVENLPGASQMADFGGWVGGGIASGAGALWDTVSGVDEETGLNRTERKWLEAQANQDSDISRQFDAALDPELVMDATRALESGEWTEELAQAYQAQQKTDVENRVFNWMEDKFQRGVARPLSTGLQVGAMTGDEDAFAGINITDPDFWEGETWREAWERSENISPGRALADRFTEIGSAAHPVLPDSMQSVPEDFDLAEVYEQGFDENGNPVNQAYADLRSNLGYNIVSGTADFAARWYLDPFVLGGQAAGATRALVKADWNRMPRRTRRKVMNIVSTPAERWDDMRSRLHMANPVDRRAVALRDNMYQLRDQIRANPDHWDAVRLAEEVPALKDDMLSAGLFRDVALYQRSHWDSANSQRVPALTDDGAPVYDDSRWETGVAAMMGNGRARAELATIKELDDEFYYAMNQSSQLLKRDTDKLKLLEHEETQRANIERFRGLGRVGERRDPTAKERWANIRSTRESIAEKAERAKEIEAQLGEYDKYRRFMNATLNSADSQWLRYGQFRPKPRKYNKITHRVLKPGNAAGVTATVTSVPRSAWLLRSNAIDLSGHGSLQTQAPRMLDEAAATVDNADTLNAFAQDRGMNSWNEARRTLLNRAASARNDRERMHAARELEDVTLEAVATKHNMTRDEALEVMSRIRGRQGEIFADVRKQAMDARAQGFSEHDIRRYTYAEGSNSYTVDAPMPLTQLQNYHIPISSKDLDRFLTQYGDALKNSFRQTLSKGKGVTNDALDIFNTFWKVGVLFRFGYPIRTVSEESLRILGHTGSFQHLLQDLPKALGTGMVNTGKRTANFALRHTPTASRWRGAQISYTTHQGQSSRRVSVGPGQTFESSFAPGSGDIFTSLNSAGASVDRLFRAQSAEGLKLRRGAARTRQTMEDEKGHAEAWADVLNNQVRYDPIWQRMLRGDTDDRIVHALKNEAWGKDIIARNPVRGNDPERWVDEMRANLDELAPDDVEDIREMLRANKEIDHRYLQRIIDDQDRHSPVTIDGASMELVTGKGSFADAVYKGVETGYHVLATLPTNVLARNPFFDRQYRHHLQNLTDDLPDGYVLSNSQQKAFENQSRHFALNQVKRYLFNTIDNDTDFIQQFRFLSPFMGAWKETMKAWGRVVTENPESFQRLYVNGWEKMGDLMFVTEVDKDGRTEDDPEHGDLDRLQVAVPKEMVKALSYTIPGDTGKTFRDTIGDLDADNDGAIKVNVTKQTLNTTLQGDPFWLPAGGPIVQIGANEAIGDMPELADQSSTSKFLYKYLFPIGAPDDIWDSIAPTLVRRVRRFADGMNDPVFSNTATLLHKAKMYEWEQNGRPTPTPPDPRESVEQAKAIQASYIAGAVGSPFSFRLESDMQLFVDKAHQYQDEFGWEEGYKRYIEDFGDDVYYFWYSNSKNNVGVPATSEGWKMTKKHRDLIEKYPNIGLAIVGMNTQDSPFNYNVWAQQARTETYPGSGDLMRDRRSPDEAVAYSQEQEGWQKWRELSTAIDAELVSRGIVENVNGEQVAGSIQRSGAEDLQYLKSQYREMLREQYPGWSDSYDQIDKGSSYRIVEEFRGVLRDGTMTGRPEWEGVAKYMELHDAVAAELDARAQAGGSPNIENDQNRDLLRVFNAHSARLVQDNPAFADVYHRFLERHVPSNGSNGQTLGFEE